MSYFSVFQHGRTALYYSCMCNYAATVALLLQYSANVNHIDKIANCSILMKCCMNGLTNIVTLLLQTKKVNIEYEDTVKRPGHHLLFHC